MQETRVCLQMVSILSTVSFYDGGADSPWTFAEVATMSCFSMVYTASNEGRGVWRWDKASMGTPFLVSLCSCPDPSLLFAMLQAPRKSWEGREDEVLSRRTRHIASRQWYGENFCIARVHVEMITKRHGYETGKNSDKEESKATSIKTHGIYYYIVTMSD